MTKDEFLAAYARLMTEYRDAGANLGCVEVKGCTGCLDSVFCTDCTQCVRTRYSVRCHESFDLTQCTDCRKCHSSSYCIGCDNCAGSHYLVNCSACSECDYCFGCVGLVKKDFHILNQKYSRGEYFKRVAALREELGMPKQ